MLSRSPFWGLSNEKKPLKTGLSLATSTQAELASLKGVAPENLFFSLCFLPNSRHLSHALEFPTVWGMSIWCPLEMKQIYRKIPTWPLKNLVIWSWRGQMPVSISVFDDALGWKLRLVTPKRDQINSWWGRRLQFEISNKALCLSSNLYSSVLSPLRLTT